MTVNTLERYCFQHKAWCDHSTSIAEQQELQLHCARRLAQSAFHPQNWSLTLLRCLNADKYALSVPALSVPGGSVRVQSESYSLSG